jgi:hypothetical protein
MSASNNERHLTSREISQWLVEGPSASAEAHAANCYACQAKVAEAREPLALFRTAFVAWSEARNSRPARLAERCLVESHRRAESRAWILAPVLSLALGVALLAGFLVGPKSFRGPAAQTPVAANAPVSDAALMEQVDTEVSEAVPDAMAPLTDLVAWDSEGSVVATTSGKKAAKVKTPAGVKAKAAIQQKVQQ